MNAKKLRFWALFCLTVLSNTIQPAQADPDQANVIFITLDGVRWQEFFKGADTAMRGEANTGALFPYFWSHLAKEGVVYGHPTQGGEIEVSTPVRWSLPAYQAIMAGYNTRCFTNLCFPIQVQTFPERLVSDLNLKAKDVATFASWKRLDDAVEHNRGTTLVNTGKELLNYIDFQDPELEAINEEMKKNPSGWNEIRFDHQTYALSKWYLKKHRPRFLYISLGDSDKWAHKGEWEKYLGALRQFDDWLKDLNETLATMGDYGKNTTIIVTTDHGRGHGNKQGWKTHGPHYPSSKTIFLYAKGPQTPKLGIIQRHKKRTHLDIRPTIEMLFGLETQKCKQCGDILPEVAGLR